jgi:hypothetical protein
MRNNFLIGKIATKPAQYQTAAKTRKSDQFYFELWQNWKFGGGNKVYIMRQWRIA